MPGNFSDLSLALSLLIPKLTPNPSLHPGPATAGVVSPACASGSIVTHRAYNTCLRGPGELER